MTNQKNSKLLIIGVGNIFRHDDGIGIAAITELKKLSLPNVVLLDGGIDALALLDEIQKYQRVIIIDAVRMNTTPGTVKLFTPTEAKIAINADALSTHGFGLAELLAFVEQLQIATEIKIIGVEPEDISFGEGLSPTVQQSLSAVLKLFP